MSSHRRLFHDLCPALFFACLVALPVSGLAQVSFNVGDFGVVGDAIQCFVSTTSNSPVVTTTNQLSAADIGKSIEVFQVGTQTAGIDSYGNNTNGNQDLIAIITNVVDGTNIYISQTAQATLTNTFATYGHNNCADFQNAINNCAGYTNAVLNIPAGKYLFLSTYVTNLFATVEIVLYSGGIHFVGAGTNSTTLLGQGAWTLQAGVVKRGFLFAIIPPVSNDFPVSFENLTLDGGVQMGNTPIHGTYPNLVDGQGWDVSHGAIDIRGFTGRVFTHQLWTNVVFTHWRGEMVKSNDTSTNGNISAFNCVFADGNATAINIYASLNVSNCVFNNLFQVAEYYQKYSTNISCFQNNLITNISANLFALNGATGYNPPFVFQGNTFYFAAMGCNGIETTPGDNIVILSNRFICQNGVHAQNIVLGCPGYQGYFDNSNIIIAGNIFVQPTIAVEIAGGGSATDPNRVEAVQVYSNTVYLTNASVMALQTYGWSTNVYLFDNDFSSQVTNGNVSVISGLHGGQFAKVDTNNLYYSYLYDAVGKTNPISYGSGSRFVVSGTFHQGTVYVLTDTNGSQIPPGAQMVIKNGTLSSASVPLYLDSAMTIGPVIITNGLSMAFNWTNGGWQLPPGRPRPPTNLRVVPSGSGI